MPKKNKVFSTSSVFYLQIMNKKTRKQERIKFILSWAKLETTDDIKGAAIFTVFMFNECYLNETCYYLFE